MISMLPHIRRENGQWVVGKFVLGDLSKSPYIIFMYWARGGTIQEAWEDYRRGPYKEARMYVDSRLPMTWRMR
jgi:hypothetical protein